MPADMRPFSLAPATGPRRGPGASIASIASIACMAWLLALTACGGNSGGGGGGGGAKADASGGDSAGDGIGGADASDAKSDAGQGDSAGGDTATGDAKDAVDAGPPCTLPEEGTCTGTTVYWCEEGAAASYDCKESDPAAVCSVLPDWGADCLLPKETVCTYLDENGESAWTFCQGKDAGCVAGDDEDSYCTEGVGVCAEEDIDGCLGAYYVLDCSGGQALALDCKASGGTCGDSPAADKACIGVVKGSWCDDGYVYCAAGLKCVIPPDEEAGTCQ